MKTKVKQYPLIASTEMVRGILSGAKTQFRRVIKPQPNPPYGITKSCMTFDFNNKAQPEFEGLGWYYHPFCPYGKVGDQIWIRETWTPNEEYDGGFEAEYCAYTPRYYYKADYGWLDALWKPSIHMPKDASRLLLEITSIKVEQLQNISENDARNEGFGQKQIWQCDGPIDGCGQCESCNPLIWFKNDWNSIHNNKQGKDINYPWESNPWVWVIEFRRIK